MNQDLPAARKLAIPSLLILVLMISVGPFGDTIYAPALPSIQHAFDTSYHHVQLTITFYLLGYSISQLLYGPLSDRFGRKIIMIIGAVIFVLGSSICLFSNLNIVTLITGRFFQGIGACAGAVISAAAVRDAFPLADQGKVFAKVNIAFALAPGLGAVVGTFTSWYTNFVILFVLAWVLLIAVVFLFPETLKQKNKGAARPINLLINYFKLFKAPGYFIYLLILGLNMGMIYGCLVEAPGLVINVMELEKPYFVVIAAGIVLAFMIGSVICAYLAHRLRDDFILLIGMLVSLVGGIILFFDLYWGDITLTKLLIPVIIVFIGIAFMVPIATALALRPFKNTAGAASAMMGFFQMGMASGITALITIVHLPRHLAMPSLFIALPTIGVIVIIAHLIFVRMATVKKNRINKATTAK